MEQFVLVPASVYINKCLNTQTVTEQELPKYQGEPTPTYQNDSLNKEIKQKLFGKADFLVDQILSCPRIKLSNLETLISDGVKTGVSLSDFPHQLRRKNADVPDIYFILLDAAGKYPTLVHKQNATTKKRGNWVPFKIWMSEAAKAVCTIWCCLWVCAQLSEN